MATTIINNFISPRTPFTMVIKTDNLSAGSTADNQFRIPHYTTGTYNYKVDWGDGVVENVVGNTSPTHTYASIGTYTVKIWGIFQGMSFGNVNDRLKILNIAGVDKRNTQRLASNAYLGCQNLLSVPSYPSIVDSATNNLFSGCTSLESFGWHDFSSSNHIFACWENCTSLTSFPLLDTSLVTNFDRAWNGCTSLTSFPLINTSSGTSFYAAWNGCTSLTSFPLLDTSSGTNFAYAWNGCSSLTSFPLLDTSSGTNFQQAWFKCSSLTSFPLLDTSSGTNFGLAWFQCSSLTSFPLLDTSSATSFQLAWYDCSSLTSFPANFFDTWVGVPVFNCFLNTWLNCYALTTTSVENILVSIDTSGKSAPAGATGTQADITINYKVATGALTGATNTAITNLKAKGWTPTINYVYV